MLYAGNNATGVSKSRDGGKTWFTANRGLVSPVPILLSDPSSRNTLYAGVFNIYPSAKPVYKTTNGAGRWIPAAAQDEFGGSGVNAMAIAASEPSTLYVTVAYSDRVYKTSDGGQNWHLANHGLERHIVIPIKVDPSSALVAYVGTEVGLYKTIDGGESWNPAGAGLPYPAIFALEIDPNFPDTIYVATSDQTYAPGGISKSTDGGATWMNLQGFPNGIKPLVNAIVVPEGAPGRVYAAGNGVLASNDGGASWSDLSSPDVYSIFGLSVVPGSPATLYAVDAVHNLWKRTIDAIPAPCYRCARVVPFH